MLQPINIKDVKITRAVEEALRKSAEVGAQPGSREEITRNCAVDVVNNLNTLRCPHCSQAFVDRQELRRNKHVFRS